MWCSVGNKRWQNLALVQVCRVAPDGSRMQLHDASGRMIFATKDTKLIAPLTARLEAAEGWARGKASGDADTMYLNLALAPEAAIQLRQNKLALTTGVSECVIEEKQELERVLAILER